MMMLALLLALQQEPARPLAQPYAAWLDTPGGHLDFGLELVPESDGDWSACLVNGEERISVPRVAFDGQDLVLDMPHYDSRIRARVTGSGSGLEGTWEKRRGPEATARVPFRAVRAGQVSPSPSGNEKSGACAGRWSVAFETESQPAVAVFEHVGALSALRGTFLTSTGDYRYLAGTGTEEGLRLSCFDGAHAFLFEARLQPDGTLAGDFWSGDWHHETWTARRDDAARLADGFAQTTWNGKTRLADLTFPDLEGTPRALADFAGQATLLVGRSSSGAGARTATTRRSSWRSSTRSTARAACASWAWPSS